MPLTNTDIRDIQRRAAEPGANLSALGREYHVTRQAIQQIRAGTLGGKRLSSDDARDRAHRAAQGAQGIARAAGSPDWRDIEQTYLTTGVWTHAGEVYTDTEAANLYDAMIASLNDF